MAHLSFIMQSRRTPVRYPNEYVWFVFVSALDLMLTWIVLHFGGREANGIANTILRNFGLVGFVIFKFGLVVLVICICEVVGRHNDRVARRIAMFAVGVTCLPVLLSILLLLTH
jgi:hypothetical protein